MPPCEEEGAERRLDLRMPLLGLGAWGGALAAVVLGPRGLLWPGLPVLVLLVLLLLAARRRAPPAVAGLVAAVVLTAAVVAAAAGVRELAVAEGPVAALAADRAAVSLSGVVASDPRPVDGGFGPRVAVRLRVTSVTGRGLRHRVSAPLLVLGGPEWEGAALGSTVSTGGRLATADDGDLAAILVGASAPRTSAAPDAWWRGAEAVRAGIRASVHTRPVEQRSLVPALVDGDDAGLPADLEADFRTTGLTHLTAVSGTNLTLVVGFLLVVARWCRVRGRWLLLVGAAGIVGFVLLARTEPSVVRAAVMGSVGLVALGVNGRHRALRALGVAVVVLLLLVPTLAVSVGFALSVLATAGIVLLAPVWRDALARWMPRWCAEAVAVPATAQLACTPLVAAISGQVSLVAVGANLLVAPAVGPATVLGLAGGLVTLVSPTVGGVLGWLAATCVGWIVVVAQRGAALPAAALDWGTGPGPLVLLVALCAGVALAGHRLLRRPVTGLACGVLVVAVVAVRLPTPGWPPAGWVLAMCDVGQGDAVVLRSGPSSAVVVDAGPDPGQVDDCLDRLEVRQVPLVVLTHFHADHVDGLPGVLDGRTVGAVETTRTLDPASGVQQTVAAVSREGLVAGAAPFGTTRTVGDVRLQVLWPRPGPFVAGSGDGSRANDASVVLLVESQGLRLLLTGDVEPPGQAAIGRLVPAMGDLDVLKVPHHGSRYQDLDWLTSLDAEVAVVSVGADNDYGHPAPEVLSALADGGTEVHRTDEEGDLLVLATPSGPEVRARDP